MSYIKRSKRNGKVYLSEVETKRVNGKVVTKHLRYLGREADGKTILSSSISEVSVSKVTVYGPLLVLNHLANEMDVTEDKCLKALDALESMDSTVLQQAIFDNVRRKYKIQDKGILYDVTNTSPFKVKKCTICTTGDQ